MEGAEHERRRAKRPALALARLDERTELGDANIVVLPVADLEAIELADQVDRARIEVAIERAGHRAAGEQPFEARGVDAARGVDPAARLGKPAVHRRGEPGGE